MRLGPLGAAPLRSPELDSFFLGPPPSPPPLTPTPVGSRVLLSRSRAEKAAVLAFPWTRRLLLRSLRTGSCHSPSRLCPKTSEVRSREPSEGGSQGMLRVGEGDTYLFL